MLTSGLFFLFLAVPAVLVLACGLCGSSREAISRNRRWSNFALALLVGGLVAAPYYLPILPILVKKTVVPRGGAADGFSSPFTLASARFHLEAAAPETPRLAFDRHHGNRDPGLPLAGPENAPGRLFFCHGPWACMQFSPLPWPTSSPVSPSLAADLAPDGGGRSGGPLAQHHVRRGRTRVAIGALALMPVAGLTGGWRAEETGDWNIRPLVVRLEENLADGPILRKRSTGSG